MVPSASVLRQRPQAGTQAVRMNDAIFNTAATDIAEHSYLIWDGNDPFSLEHHIPKFNDNILLPVNRWAKEHLKGTLR